MIAIIPDQVTQWRPVTPALRRLFQRVKRLPFDGARAWVSFPRDGTEPPAPDFLILDLQNRAFLLSSGDISLQATEELLQPGLFELTDATQKQAGALRVAATGLARFFDHDSVVRFLVLPGIPDSLARSLGKHLEIESSIVVSGEPESLAEWLSSHAAAPLEIDVSHALQATFNLESRIPPAFVPRTQTRVNYGQEAIDPRETTYLLDFDQEAWVKSELMISSEALESISGTPARLITGVAGSGKSLALLYRARLQAKCAASASRCTLFITHNKPLIGDLKWRYGRLAAMMNEGGAEVEATHFVHFFRWCGTLRYDEKLSLIGTQERKSHITRLANEAFPNSGLSDSFFIDEIGFIADQIDDSAPGYLAMDRTGRGIALDRNQRLKMHAVYQRYRSSLAVNRETDWPFIVRMVWEKVRAGQLRLPRYDTIFIDEAQFFAPVWFAILKACLKAPGGEFVVAADPTQGFLKRRLSWRAVGLNVVGRAARLKKSYRNTPAIQAFARRFYNSRIQASEHLAEETILPEGGEGITQHTRDTPRLIKHRAVQDSILWTANEIAASVRSGLSPGAVLVLIEDRSSLDALRATLEGKLGSDKVTLLSHQAPSAASTVAIATFNSATGIERPVVFLLGIDTLFESEGDPRLDHRQRSEMIRDHTRKIYMALTRAGEKLLISYRHDSTRALLEGTSEASPSVNLDANRL